MNRYKVKEVIQMLEADGWTLSLLRATIDNSSILIKKEKLQ